MPNTWHITRRSTSKAVTSYCGLSTTDKDYYKRLDYIGDYQTVETMHLRYPDDLVCAACSLLAMEHLNG
jgi:hypothetical protein